MHDADAIARMRDAPFRSSRISSFPLTRSRANERERGREGGRKRSLEQSRINDKRGKSTEELFIYSDLPCRLKAATTIVRSYSIPFSFYLVISPVQSRLGAVS